jgi:hypothetical protein
VVKSAYKRQSYYIRGFDGTGGAIRSRVRLWALLRKDGYSRGQNLTVAGVEGRRGINYYNKRVRIRRRRARRAVSGACGYAAAFTGIRIRERASRAGWEEQRGGYSLPESKAVVE